MWNILEHIKTNITLGDDKSWGLNTDRSAQRINNMTNMKVGKTRRQTVGTINEKGKGKRIYALQVSAHSGPARPSDFAGRP